MLCVISYWVLSGAKRRQIQQLRCCVLPGTQGSAGHERICSAPFGHRAGQVSQDHADHRHSFAGEAAEAGCPAERQGSGQGESTRFRSATAEPFAGRTDEQTNGTTPHTGGALGNLNLIGKRSGQKAGTFCPGTRLQGIGGASERSLRLRSNEVPSGDFKQRNGLASARWRD